MKFTKDTPTTPGFYALRIHDLIIPTRIVDCDELGLCCDDGNNTDPLPIGGEWCRLVPAEEVEKAWFEAMDACDSTWVGEIKPSSAWPNSRAKRVMEGRE